ncbi:MAG: hypothetical protein V1832_00095 [Nitrospirota bacterium]
MDESIKKQVRELLRKKDYDRLVELCEIDRHFWKALRFCLYEIDETIRWPAIETAAKLMKRWWLSKKQEKVREFIRNLFWSMSDESGGIGWSSPQTVAAIIMSVPEVLDPYGSMMIAHSIEEPLLVKGGLWGIGRMGKVIADDVDFFQDKVLAAFQSDDAETLGLAAWAMGEVGYKPALPFLENLLGRSEPVRIYVKGDFFEKPLGYWAEEAMNKIARSL